MVRAVRVVVAIMVIKLLSNQNTSASFGLGHLLLCDNNYAPLPHPYEDT